MYPQQQQQFYCRSDSCTAAFSSSDSLKEHVRLSHVDLQCPLVNITISWNTLSRRKFQLYFQCERRFATPHLLTNHLKAHQVHPNVAKQVICMYLFYDFILFFNYYLDLFLQVIPSTLAITVPMNTNLNRGWCITWETCIRQRKSTISLKPRWNDRHLKIRCKSRLKTVAQTCVPIY